MKLFRFAPLLLSLSTFASPYAPSLRLSELPDGAKLHVKSDLQLESSDYDRPVFHTSFRAGRINRDKDLTDPGVTLLSRVILRTDSTASLELRTVSGIFHNYGAHFLKAGTYCLNLKQSSFGSSDRSAFSRSMDRLVFENCESKQKAFTVYSIAGIKLRQFWSYHGYTVNLFEGETGKLLEFVK